MNIYSFLKFELGMQCQLIEEWLSIGFTCSMVFWIRSYIFETWYMAISWCIDQWNLFQCWNRNTKLIKISGCFFYFLFFLFLNISKKIKWWWGFFRLVGLKNWPNCWDVYIKRDRVAPWVAEPPPANSASSLIHTPQVTV